MFKILLLNAKNKFYQKYTNYNFSFLHITLFKMFENFGVFKKVIVK